MSFSNAFSAKEIFCILQDISFKFVPQSPVGNNLVLVQVMAWRWTGDKQPIPEPILIQFTAAYVRHQGQLEQLEHLRSEITHTIDSHQIPSQNKTKSKLQI